MSFKWFIISRHWSFWLEGILNTLKLTFICEITAFIFGLVCALIVVFRIPVICRIVSWIVRINREIPLLLTIYFIYFALPHMGITLPTLICGVLALTLCNGSFMAEIIRGSIEGISIDQFEAAKSVGMSRLQGMRYIILPQALRNAIPSLLGQASIILKDTALLKVLAIKELFWHAETLNFELAVPFTVYIFVNAIYVILFWSINLIGNFLENNTSNVVKKNELRY